MSPKGAHPPFPASDSGSNSPISNSTPVRLEFQDRNSPMATETTALAGAGPVQPPTGLMAVWARLKDTLGHSLSERKPWSELVDRNSFSKPASVAEATGRVQKNLNYYRTNYFIFFLAMMALTFLTHPGALVWTGLLLCGWVYLFLLRPTPLVIAGREYSDREKLLGMAALSFVVVFFLTNVGATVLYGASLSAVVVAAHAAFREPDDLFLDEGPTTGGSFFNVNLFPGVQTLPQASQV